MSWKVRSVKLSDMGSMSLRRSRTFGMSPDVIWPIVADLDGYSDHVANLAVTEVLSGQGVGAVRRCENDRGQDWREAVVEWEDGRRYVIDVDTTTYPAPLRQMFRRFRGTWTVDPAPEGCEVTIRFDADIRGGPLGTALVRRMARSAERDLESILDSYGAAAESR